MCEHTCLSVCPSLLLPEHVYLRECLHTYAGVYVNVCQCVCLCMPMCMRMLAHVCQCVHASVHVCVGSGGGACNMVALPRGVVHAAVKPNSSCNSCSSRNPVRWCFQHVQKHPF